MFECITNDNRSITVEPQEHHRSNSPLHVAAALTLGARVFVSSDDRPRKIARRARLKVLPRIRP